MTTTGVPVRKQRPLLVSFTLAFTGFVALDLRADEARTVERILPQDTLFVAFVNDSELLEKSTASLPMNKILAEPEVQKFLEKPMAAVHQMAAKLSDRMKKEKGFEDFEISIDRLTAGSYGRCFAALTHVSLPDEQRHDPDIGLVFGVERRQGTPDWIAFVKDIVSRIAVTSGSTDVTFRTETEGEFTLHVLEGANEADRPPFVCVDVNGLQLFSTSKSALLDILAREKGAAKGSLLDNPDWQLARKRLGPNRPDSAQLYVNFAGGVKLAKDGLKLGMTKEPKLAEKAEAIDRVLEKSGLLALRSMLVTSQASDGVSESTGFMVVRGERKGILAMASGKTIDLSQLKWVPDSASSFSLSNIDINPFYDFAMDAVLEFDPEMHKQITESIAQFGSQIGGAENPIRLKEDLFQNIGPSFLVLAPKKASMLTQIPPYLAAMEVRNGERVVECLSKVLEFAGSMVGQQVKVESEQKKGYTLYEISLGGELAMFRPAFTVAGNYLYLSTEPGLIKQQMKRLEKGEMTDITSNPDYQRFSGRIPKEGLVALGYSDTRYSFESVYDLFISTVPMLMQMSEFEIPIDFQIAPMRETISQHLFGSLNFSVDTPEGWRFDAYGPIGGEAMGLVGAAAIGAGLFMAGNQMDRHDGAAAAGSPSAPTRPEATPEEQAKTDLKKLSSTIVLYRLEADKLPDSLDELVKPLENYPAGVWDSGPLPTDPWGHPYRYSVSGKEHQLWSCGPNGEDENGAGDDIMRSSGKN